MKIYFLNAPFIPRFSRMSRWESIDRGGTVYYPYWLSYATGVAEQSGHEARLVDAQAWKWTLKDIIGDIDKFNPEMCVIDSSFSSLSNDINVAESIKNANESIKTVIVGTPTARFSDKILKSQGVDFVARFEYDFTIRDLARVKTDDLDLRDINGISYRDSGKIITNPDREFISSEELDSIPFVSRVYKKHLKIKDYFLAQCLNPVVQIFTGRGCPSSCTFCSWPENLMGRRYRFRSANNVVEELEYIQNELPMVNEIFIEDDTFTANPKRVREICEEIKRRKLKINWSCNARANLDYETMKLMKAAGCRLLDVGYESGNDAILKNIKKGVNVAQMREFTSNAKRANLMILADFIIGLPGETKETAAKTIEFVNELRPELMQFSVACPVPGTQFYEWVKENGYLVEDNPEEFLDRNGLQKSVISYPQLNNEEIVQLVDQALKNYYLNLRYVPIAFRSIMRKNGLLELKRITISAKRFMKYAMMKGSSS